MCVCVCREMCHTNISILSFRFGLFCCLPLGGAIAPPPPPPPTVGVTVVRLIDDPGLEPVAQRAIAAADSKTPLVVVPQ